VLQCVAVRCSVLHCVTESQETQHIHFASTVLQCVAVCCSVLQCVGVAVCCGVLQCVTDRQKKTEHIHS